jgi:phage-related protein
MPATRVILFRELDGTVPLLEWLDEIPDKAVDKCLVRLRRLAELGHELRRPEADLLRDGIYELRVGLNGINYRMLYFFHETLAAVVSHGLVKQRAVPPIEIERAIRRMQQYIRDSRKHTAEVEL